MSTSTSSEPSPSPWPDISSPSVLLPRFSLISDDDTAIELILRWTHSGIQVLVVKTWVFLVRRTTFMCTKRYIRRFYILQKAIFISGLWLMMGSVMNIKSWHSVMLEDILITKCPFIVLRPNFTLTFLLAHQGHYPHVFSTTHCNVLT